MGNGSISPPDPPLDDGVAMLRPLDERDAAAVERASRDAEIVRWMGLARGSAEESVARARARWEEGRGAVFALCAADAPGTCVGSVILELREAGRADVAYWVLPEARGRGPATRGLRVASEWALRALPIARLQLWTNPENVRSQRVAERAGFTREGTLPAYLEAADGGRVDALFFSLLPADLG
jgi:ribosomal-protein-alanine N-acetyltransferase